MTMTFYRTLLAAACVLPLAACVSGLPHGNLAMPDMSGTPGFGDSAFNGKNYPDPNPHSASDDQQRAAYQQHQQEQRDQQATVPSIPDPGPLNCAGTSSSQTASNAGTFTSHTSCHN